ncbi:dopaminechrome tautomerase-like [Onthophagus taurus]|uniref:dopaminechrome tautomerase-like n=1 Tax=Onthophagus taurus TaxID=166361 RepID=UPI0039BDC5FE
MLLLKISFLLCNFYVLIQSGFGQLPPERFRVIKEWKYINFTWPDFNTLRSALTRGEYIPQNVLMAGINYYEDYYYLALPRMKFGVPITLGRIPINSTSKPLIEPFPSWEMNKLNDCNSLQNVQNVAVDQMKRMWIIDGGKTNTLNKNPTTICDPKLVIFNMEMNAVESVHVFPPEVANKNVSFLYDIVIDDDFAYITDNSRIEPGLIVYSRLQDKSWKIQDETMKADESAIEFTVDDIRISTPISIAGLALSPKINNTPNRLLFFCPMSSTNLYSIKTNFLKDQSFMAGKKFTGEIIKVGNKGGQTDGMKMDNKGILYFGLLPSSSIIRWNSSQPFVSSQKVIARDQKFIQWPNSFAFDDLGNIVVLTNSLQKYIQGKMDIEEPNFRILKAYTNGKSYVYPDESFSYIIQDSVTSKNDQPNVILMTNNDVKMNEIENEDVTIKKMTSTSTNLQVTTFGFCVIFSLTFGFIALM